MSNHNVVRKSIFEHDSVDIKQSGNRRRGRPRNTWTNELRKRALIICQDADMLATIMSKESWDAKVKTFLAWYCIIWQQRCYQFRNCDCTSLFGHKRFLCNLLYIFFKSRHFSFFLTRTGEEKPVKYHIQLAMRMMREAPLTWPGPHDGKSICFVQFIRRHQCTQLAITEVCISRVFCRKLLSMSFAVTCSSFCKILHSEKNSGHSARVVVHRILSRCS